MFAGFLKKTFTSKCSSQTQTLEYSEMSSRLHAFNQLRRLFSGFNGTVNIHVVDFTGNDEFTQSRTMHLGIAIKKYFNFFSTA